MEQERRRQPPERRTGVEPAEDGLRTQVGRSLQWNGRCEGGPSGGQTECGESSRVEVGPVFEYAERTGGLWQGTESRLPVGATIRVGEFGSPRNIFDKDKEGVVRVAGVTLTCLIYKVTSDGERPTDRDVRGWPWGPKPMSSPMACPTKNRVAEEAVSREATIKCKVSETP